MKKFNEISRQYAHDVSLKSYVPYSKQPRGALAVLSNGDWVCGVQIENASYPLMIPAVTSALVSAASIGRKDVVGVVVSGKITEEEKSIVMQHAPLDQLDSDILGQKGSSYCLKEKPVIMFNHLSKPLDSQSGIHLAREASHNAYVPESDFPVGAIAVTGDHKYFQGSNIECGDWTKILCAERAALAAAISAGETNIKHIYVSCIKSFDATPCGACRQVIHEVAPESTIWMDRGEHMSENFQINDLLPHAFVLSI